MHHRWRGRRLPISRIVLIGFMGAGKTTVGRRLAELLGWALVDFDAEIERRTGQSVGEIFEHDGEGTFRAWEARLTHEFADAEHAVLAPGGGWITQPRLIELLEPDSLVVWLRVSPEEAVRRATRDRVRRPLLAGPDPIGSARRLIREREPLYRLADAAVDVDGRGTDELAHIIAELAEDEPGE